MKKSPGNNIKTGAFVLAGLLFLVFMLYMIGKNQHLFGATFELKARFDNVQGLVAGNNVRYAGIEVGTVKEINIVSDTVIEVKLAIEDRMRTVIRANAIVTIGTDGLMGNKIVNMAPAASPASLATGEIPLTGRKAIDTDELFNVMGKTANDLVVIAENLKTTTTRLNGSTALWTLLNDNTLPANIRASARNIQSATARADRMLNDMQSLVADIKSGKGAVGAIIRDTLFVKKLNETLSKINGVGEQADKLSASLNTVIAGVENDINHGRGPINALLKDSAMVAKIGGSLSNIEKGTDAFNQNMEALKHNFLFRGYFKKLEKQQRKSQQVTMQ